MMTVKDRDVVYIFNAKLMLLDYVAGDVLVKR